MSALLPHLNAALNLAVVVLLAAGFVAIRQDRRTLHPKLMLSAIGVGVLFLVGYVAQVILVGHQRFPGDDWVRTAFLVVLGTHTLLAVVVVPMIVRTAYLGLHARLAAHRRLARVTFSIWMYVGLTGLFIYAMNNYVRPPLAPS